MRALWIVMALMCAACGATSTGGSCTSSGSCGGGLCLQSSDFPGGYCSQGCTLSDPSSCGSGSVCIDDASGAPPGSNVSAVCYQTCTTNSDCRPGYGCLEKAGHMVCRNNG